MVFPIKFECFQSNEYSGIHGLYCVTVFLGYHLANGSSHIQHQVTTKAKDGLSLITLGIYLSEIWKIIYAEKKMRLKMCPVYEWSCLYQRCVFIIPGCYVVIHFF